MVKEVELGDGLEEAVREAEKVLREDGVIVYPTDTLYGIGGNALKNEVQVEIQRIKNREAEKQMSVLVGGLKMIKQMAAVGEWEEKIVDALLPGPVTLIMESKLDGQDGIGIRMSDDKFTRKLMQRLDFPVITTSANLVEESSWQGEGEVPEFLQEVDLVVRGSILKGRPSTVVDIRNKEIKILREGVWTEEDIKRKINGK